MNQYDKMEWYWYYKHLIEETLLLVLEAICGILSATHIVK